MAMTQVFYDDAVREVLGLPKEYEFPDDNAVLDWLKTVIPVDLRFCHDRYDVGFTTIGDLSEKKDGKNLVGMARDLGYEFICKNPIRRSEDGDRTRDKLSEIRNLVIESDEIPLTIETRETWIEYQREIYKVVNTIIPDYSIVFSGSKSLQYWVCLDSSTNLEQYRKLGKAIENAFEYYNLKIDTGTPLNNPESIIRLPNGMRDTGIIQRMVLIGGTCDYDDVLDVICTKARLSPDDFAVKTATKARKTITSDKYLAFGNTVPDQKLQRLIKSAIGVAEGLDYRPRDNGCNWLCKKLRQMEIKYEEAKDIIVNYCDLASDQLPDPENGEPYRRDEGLSQLKRVYENTSSKEDDMIFMKSVSENKLEPMPSSTAEPISEPNALLRKAESLWNPEKSKTPKPKNPYSGLNFTIGGKIVPQPEREAIIDCLVRRRQTLNLISAAKVGKSIMVEQGAVCVAAGVPFLGFGTRKGRVLLIDTENDDINLNNRILAIAAALGVRQDELNDLHILALNGRFLDIFQIEELLQGEYELVILDCLYNMKPANMEENSNDDMTVVYRAIRGIAEKTNSAVLVVHHTAKGGTNRATMDAGSGAGAIGRATGSQIFIRPTGDGTGENTIYEFDAACRSFPPRHGGDMKILFKYPIWKLAGDVANDPDDLAPAAISSLRWLVEVLPLDGRMNKDELVHRSRVRGLGSDKPSTVHIKAGALEKWLTVETGGSNNRTQFYSWSERGLAVCGASGIMPKVASEG